MNFSIKKTEIIEFDDFIDREIYDLKEYLYFKLSKLHHLDSIKNAFINKLIVNDLAEDIGLIVPKSYIFSNKESLKNLLENSENDFITKSITGDPVVDFKSHLILNYTSKVQLNDIKTDFFSPSLLQNCIDKRYELRIFYFMGNCYTMAIFSQKDKQTEIDFRVYNDAKPNRRVNFNLPQEIKEKIHILMIKLGFDTGSIDMIVTIENKYVFLEVNPVGQFGMTSFPCNYNLEKKIAEYL